MLRERDRSDDAALMEGIRSHDCAAFEALYDAYHRVVYGVALRVIGDARAAEDATQAVFLKVWTSPQLFRGGNLPAWIARVARNHAIDVARGNAGRAAAVPDVPPFEEGPEEIAVRSMEALALRAALDRIPPEQRELVDLAFFGGLTHDEISRTTGQPLGTVKTRIRAGLRRLREELQGTKER